MISTDIVTGHPFTPSWRKESDKAPVYYLRAGSVIERAQVEAELAGVYGAGKVYAFETIEAFESGIRTLLADHPELDTLLELMEQEKAGEALPPDKQQLLAEARNVLKDHWQPYRDLIAQQERRREIAPIVIFRRFCTGWDNVDSAYARGADRLVSEDVLPDIDPLELKAAGNFGYELLYGSVSERNFPQPSPSDEAPQTSNSDMSSEGGSSEKSDGKKTRGSRSRNGPSA